MAKPPVCDWEIVLVDNGSTDHTRSIIEEAASDLPIRRCYEPQAGLSRARNAGLREAAGEYILWTDDDVMVSQTWLTYYV
jgi:glycosyltransferase involved in cell wall biosynthesis